MKWRAFGRMPQWVRLSEWLGVTVLPLHLLNFDKRIWIHRFKRFLLKARN